MSALHTISICGSLGIWSTAVALTAWGTRLALRLLGSQPQHLDAPFGFYPVSILKPLKGVDASLRENLESFFKLDYPEFELLFSIARSDDPAGAFVSELMRRHPHVRARLFVGEVKIGPNPKVNNLIHSYEGSRHDWVLISDSNVRVAPDYLKRMIAHLDPSVGMVTSIVAGRHEQGTGGQLEAIYLNTFYARGMCLADWAGHPCVVGKSMLFRRSTAKRFGGIRALGRYLAEDYMAGEAIRSLGLEVRMACDPITQVIGRHSLRDFWSRHLRWGRIRKAQAPIAFALEPLSGCFVSGALGAWGALHAFGVSPHAFLAAHLGFWALCDLLLMLRLSGELRAEMPIAWFLRELLALPLWAHIAAGSKVNWRGTQLRLQPGGLVEE